MNKITLLLGIRKKVKIGHDVIIIHNFKNPLTYIFILLFFLIGPILGMFLGYYETFTNLIGDVKEEYSRYAEYGK